MESRADLSDFRRALGRAGLDTLLAGDGPFTAKLNATYAPYEDYDQLMRLEEWYARD